MSSFGTQKALKIGFRNHSKINENLSCQKTESTIVLAMLQSTGKAQVVFSHKRGTDNASEVVFGTGLRRSLDHATESLRFAALARSNGEDGKEKGCTEGAKRPPRIMCVFRKRDFKNAQKWYRKQNQIIEMMLERFPLKLEACIT